MTWDPLELETLGENWVAAPEVVVPEEKIDRRNYLILYIEKVL